MCRRNHDRYWNRTPQSGHLWAGAAGDAALEDAASSPCHFFFPFGLADLPTAAAGLPRPRAAGRPLPRSAARGEGAAAAAAARAFGAASFGLAFGARLLLRRRRDQRRDRPHIRFAIPCTRPLYSRFTNRLDTSFLKRHCDLTIAQRRDGSGGAQGAQPHLSRGLRLG
jgi:hypothetical protein